MRRLLSQFLLAVAAAAGLLAALPDAASAARARTALVIGNADYEALSSLVNPLNDAQDMAAALRESGFQVTLLTNADQRGMEEAIREFGNRLERVRGHGLFYYAGHGVERDGQNYLIPIGADVEDPADLRYKTVNASAILDHMERATNGVNVLILDACRNNPYPHFRSASRGLSILHGPKGSLIAYSTAPGDVAADGKGRNGLFTKHLLDVIRLPGLDLERSFSDVRRRVSRESGGRQIPWSNSSVLTDFYFTRGKGALPAGPAPAEMPEPEGERRFTLRDDESLSDAKTGLSWYVPKDSREMYTHKEGTEHARKLWLPSGTGWRLPSKHEVETLVLDDAQPLRLLGNLDEHRYSRYWLFKTSRWTAEGAVVGFYGSRMSKEPAGVTERHHLMLVRDSRGAFAPSGTPLAPPE